MNKSLQSILLGTLIAAAVFLTSSASAQTLLSVDFNGYWYQVTEPTYTGIDPAGEPNSTADFPYSIGSYTITASGIGLTQWAGDVGPNLGTALYQDYLAVSDFNILTLTIGGLDANTEYSFRAFAWRQGAGNPTLTYTPTAGTGGSAANGSYNENVLDIDDFNYFSTLMTLTSNNSGEIVVAISTNSWGGTVLNGFELSAVPEPATGAMLGLAGILWMSRRRKTAR